MDVNFQNITINMIFLISVSLAGAVYSIFVGVSRIIFKKRLRNLEVAMARYPNYADVRAQLASLYYSHGYLTEAKQYYYEALKIYKYYHYARLKLALIALEENNLEEALYHFRTLRKNVVDDYVMIELIEKMVKEKLLYDEYLKDDDRYDDEFFRKKAQE